MRDERSIERGRAPSAGGRVVYSARAVRFARPRPAVQTIVKKMLARCGVVPLADRVAAPAQPAPEPGIAWTDGSPGSPLTVRYFLDQFWCDKYGMYFQGWILCPEHSIREFVIVIGEDRQAVT